MKLTNRLKRISDLIERNTIVGDIGSDHGYLIAYLIEEGIIAKGIASDINEGPVQNCMTTIRQNGMSDRVSVRLGGGFTPYEINEIETAVIAGMGGQLIRDIFLERMDVVKTIKTFILQPMTGQDVLRQWLLNNHFKIKKEVIAVEQDRYYEILVVEHGEHDVEYPLTIDVPNDIKNEIGYSPEIDENYIGFINKKIKKYTMIKNEIEKHTSSNPKLDEANQNLKVLNEVLRCIQM